MKACRARNKNAVRYLTYWTLGLVLTLLLDICLHGVQPGVWSALLVIVPALIIAGFVYWRWTDSHERKRDVARKITDPFYE